MAKKDDDGLMSLLGWGLGLGVVAGGGYAYWKSTRPMVERIQKGDIVIVPVTSLTLDDNASAVEFNTLKSYRTAIQAAAVAQLPAGATPTVQLILSKVENGNGYGRVIGTDGKYSGIDLVLKVPLTSVNAFSPGGTGAFTNR